MLELYDLLVLGLLCAVFSLIFSSIGTYGLSLIRDWRVTRLEGQFESLQGAYYNDKSKIARQSNKADEAAFMAQAGAILQGEGEIQEKIQKVIATNPEIAMKLAPKMLKHLKI